MFPCCIVSGLLPHKCNTGGKGYARVARPTARGGPTFWPVMSGYIFMKFQERSGILPDRDGPINRGWTR